MSTNLPAFVLLLVSVAVQQTQGVTVNPHIQLGTTQHVISSHTFDTKNPELWGNKQFKEVTITRNVPVPYPIAVQRHVAVPVKIPVPIAVHNKVPILVERKIPVYVEKPIPVQVDRPVPYALPIEIPVFHKVAVEVPKPYPVHIPQPYPVYIKKPIFVKQKGAAPQHQHHHHHHQQPKANAVKRVKKSPTVIVTRKTRA
uniref:Cuticular protein (putative) n=1 Tax=Anopheles atroparvus TaxID=41427 RepID=A0A182JJK2_ANOAO